MMRLCLGCLLLISILAISTAYADTDTTAVNTANDAKQGLTVSIDLKDVDIRSAIETIFRNTGKNYTIDQNVSGSVASLSFKDVPFDSALKNLLKTAGLTYRIQDDVYLISKPAESSAIVVARGPNNPTSDSEITIIAADTTKSETIIDKIPLNYTSASEILSMLRGGSLDANEYTGRYGYGSGVGVGNYGDLGRNFGDGRGRTDYGRGYNTGYGIGYGNGGYGGYGGYGSYGGYGGGNYGGYRNDNSRTYRTW